MAKKLKAIVRLQISAGKANPAPPIGPALAGHGINLMCFLQGIQRSHVQPHGRNYARKDQHLLGRFLHLYSEDATAGERYVQVTCVFVTATGEESGAPVAARVACTDTPVIQVSAIPQSTDARVVATRLYVTTLDGKQFCAEADVPAGTTTYTLVGYFGTGQALRTQLMEPPPPGQLLEYHNGKIYIASGANVFHTQPLRYGCYLPDEDFLMYPGRVTLLKSVKAGLFTSAAQTYLERAIRTPDVQHEVALPYRAIERAAITLPHSKTGESKSTTRPISILSKISRKL